MGSKNITVPIRIEGKYLSSPKQVASALADFSKLPWYSSQEKRDVNFSQPFISKNCLRQPFEADGTLLGTGVHLHFIVPQYLGRKVPESLKLNMTEEKTSTSEKWQLSSGEMPPAPNRWLISKSLKSSETITEQWYVESDYIHQKDYQPTNYACTIPHTEDKPYRYMGRCTKLAGNKGTFPASNSVDGRSFKDLNNGQPLTVFGHGELNFSSFYPNCNTVFGFYDPDGSLDSSTYSIIGWHDSTDDDLLYQSTKKWGATLTEEAFSEKLKSTYGLELDGNNSTPTQTMPTVFYGEFVTDSEGQEPDTSKVRVALGQTGTEALSSLIGYQLAQEDNVNIEQETAKGIIEDQLESVLMFSQLDENNIDVGAKFKEVRHSKGFRPSHGGFKWTIKTNAAASLPTDTSSQVFPPLPSGIGSYLHDLNEAQQAFHRATHE
ncbi:MAG: hypothetical protein HRT88_15425, partial [Lentisphaeraceae bacterium]|nr:hypothetical protein [Lentisphaeraceae bacterium]